MKKVLFLISLCAGLVACDQNKSELYYFQHPKELGQKIMQCQHEGGSDCQQFYAYGVHFSQLIEAFRENTQLFGLKIMHAQMQEEDLKQALEKAKQVQDHEEMASLNTQLQAKSVEIAELLAVVRLFIRV